jgi:hypothetical protein
MPKFIQGNPDNYYVILEELDRLTQKRGSTFQLARKLGVDYAHLRSMKSGSESIPQHVAEALGFRLVWVRKGEK